MPQGDGTIVIALPMNVSSIGSTWLRPASAHQSCSSWRTRSGCSADRSCDEVVLEVEQLPLIGLEVEAPLEQLPLDGELPSDVVGRRLPARVVDGAAADHSKVLRARGSGAPAESAKVGTGWPRQPVAGGAVDEFGLPIPTASTTVGVMSTAWQNCGRTSPGAVTTAASG